MSKKKVLKKKKKGFLGKESFRRKEGLAWFPKAAAMIFRDHLSKIK